MALQRLPAGGLRAAQLVDGVLGDHRTGMLPQAAAAEVMLTLSTMHVCSACSTAALQHGTSGQAQEPVRICDDGR